MVLQPARIIGFRVIAMMALVASSALVADDLGKTPTFCSFDSGCVGVTSSHFGQILGVPLSTLGLVAFGIFYLLTFFSGILGRLLGPLALLAGLTGMLLAGVQFFVLKQLCPLCLVVDGSALMLAGIELGLPQKAGLQGEASGAKRLWGSLALIVAFVPLVWASLQPSPAVPPQVLAAWLPDKINLVEITSFTCPYCRSTHRAMESLRKEQGGHLHFVRFVATAPGNQKAIAAARAYLCAVRQNLGEIMADRLFESVDQSPDKLRALAVGAGLDMARFDVDWKDASLDEEITSTREWVSRQPFAGVPQIWVQDVLLLGEQSLEQLQRAVGRAKAYQKN